MALTHPSQQHVLVLEASNLITSMHTPHKKEIENVGSVGDENAKWHQVPRLKAYLRHLRVSSRLDAHLVDCLHTDLAEVRPQRLQEHLFGPPPAFHRLGPVPIPPVANVHQRPAGTSSWREADG